ncbi:MAG: hypothetical protein U5L11_13915 [Arhodomonas sp.]|nr:hypothetical protein [Arhodomonas sp.]
MTRGDATRRVPGFRTLSRTARHADNARYWLGASHYVVREFDQALSRVPARPQRLDDSGKRPDALLKSGYIHYERGRLTPGAGNTSPGGPGLSGFLRGQPGTPASRAD